MKKKDKVAKLIEDLKKLAENDFERHRIDVLERDLESPPVVHVIDENTQEFCGRAYHKDFYGHYRSTIGIHQSVYMYYKGNIREKCSIHHIDHDKTNNTIDNLLEVTNSEHRRIHAQNIGERKCLHCGKAFTAHTPTGKYCSKDCSDNHKEERNKRLYGVRQCPICKKYFVPHNHSQKYCSHTCEGKTREKCEERICSICGQNFIQKRSEQKYCSRDCSDKAHQKMKQLICPVCGQCFKQKRSEQKFCSHKCSELAHTKTKTMQLSLEFYF